MYSGYNIDKKCILPSILKRFLQIRIRIQTIFVFYSFFLGYIYQLLLNQCSVFLVPIMNFLGKMLWVQIGTSCKFSMHTGTAFSRKEHCQTSGQNSDLFYQSQCQSQVFNIEVPSSIIQLNCFHSVLFADRCIFLLQQHLHQQSL